MNENLIVDFPDSTTPRRCSHPGAGSCQKILRFSAISEMRVYETHSDINARDMWYSERDYKAMKQANTRAVQDVCQRLRCGDEVFFVGAITTGLEKLMWPKINKRAVASRLSTRAAVLEEQERQYLSGEDDPNEISRVSRHHTRWARKSAHAIALLNAPNAEF